MTIKPVADLYSISVPGGRSTTYSTDAAEASDCRAMGWEVQEYVKLERYQVAMLQGAELVSNRDELPDGWVACSERMPDDMEDVLVTDGEDVKSMWWNGNKWDSWAGKYSIDSEDVTHWMRLPSTPSK
jgi:hypothetical protein